MNILQPWNLVFFAGFVVFFWTRGVYAKRTKNEKTTVSRFDWSEKLLLLAMFPPTMVLPLLYLFTPLLGFADYKLPALVPWFGAPIMVLSLCLFWRSHADLGQNWSVSLEIRDGHQLVTRGVYRSIRHPMYLAIWLWAIAQGMLLENWLAGWSVLPVFAIMYFVRLPREEAMMSETFGGQYREYSSKTGRLLPRLRLRGRGSKEKTPT